MTDNWKTPPMSVLIALASLFVHEEEHYGPGGHLFDRASIKSILHNPEVRTWIDSVPTVLKPLRRDE